MHGNMVDELTSKDPSIIAESFLLQTLMIFFPFGTEKGFQ